MSRPGRSRCCLPALAWRRLREPGERLAALCAVLAMPPSARAAPAFCPRTRPPNRDAPPACASNAVPCSTFSLTFSAAASLGENIEFLRGMLAALARRAAAQRSTQLQPVWLQPGSLLPATESLTVAHRTPCTQRDHVSVAGRRAHKCVVFALDSFDLFARRAKQAVLYNLLDALQTSGVQVPALLLVLLLRAGRIRGGL